jgi:hypothetical protein
MRIKIPDKPATHCKSLILILLERHGDPDESRVPAVVQNGVHHLSKFQSILIRDGLFLVTLARITNLKKSQKL